MSIWQAKRAGLGNFRSRQGSLGSYERIRRITIGSLSLRSQDPFLDMLSGCDGFVLLGKVFGDTAGEGFDHNIRIGIAKEGDRLSAGRRGFGTRCDSVGSGSEKVVAPSSHEVSGIDDDGSGNGCGVDPFTFNILYLEATFGVLKEEGQGSVIRVLAGSQLSGLWTTAGGLFK